MNEYEKRAKDFLEKTGTIYTATFLRNGKYWPGDTEKRDIYTCSIVRGEYSYTTQFGTSIADTQKGYELGKKIKPTAYDFLACITKSEPPADIDDFAAEYGIELPSQAVRLHQETMREWEAISKMYNAEELAELAEIN